jgi:hypothetical protein
MLKVVFDAHSVQIFAHKLFGVDFCDNYFSFTKFHAMKNEKKKHSSLNNYSAS